MLDQIRKELRKFVETTSMSGVSRTVRAESWVARAFWVISLLVCFSMLLLQMITVVMNYCSYSSHRNLVVLQSTPNFPEVTISNIFPASDLESYHSSYKAYLEKLRFVKEQAPEDINTDDDLWNILKLLTNFNINTPLLYNFDGNPRAVESMIVECNEYGWDLFEPRNCSQNISIIRPLQLCKRVTTKGDSAAIQVILFLDNTIPILINKFFSWIRLRLATGVSVMIHQRGQQPDPATAIYAQPGTSLTIDVKQNNITRLPAPYGNCSNRKRIFPDEDNSPPSYGQETCISLCRQRQYIKKCGCLDAAEYFTETELQMTNHTFCLNITKHLEDSPKYIVNDVLTDSFWNLLNCSWLLVPNEDSCDCPVECSETQYEFSSSSVHWPNIHFQLAFYDTYIRNNERYGEKFAAYEKLRMAHANLSDAETIDELQKLKLIEQNFIQITVKMQRKCVQLIKE